MKVMKTVKSKKELIQFFKDENYRFNKDKLEGDSYVSSDGLFSIFPVRLFRNCDKKILMSEITDKNLKNVGGEYHESFHFFTRNCLYHKDWLK